jgi:hypothetical protein
MQTSTAQLLKPKSRTIFKLNLGQGAEAVSEMESNEKMKLVVSNCKQWGCVG